MIFLLLHSCCALNLRFCDDCCDSWCVCNNVEAGLNPDMIPSLRNLPEPGRECILKYYPLKIIVKIVDAAFQVDDCYVKFKSVEN